MTKRFGFTLAEVLITLGIIGVVAAMTIPTLISNTNGAQFKTAYKKALSTLNQAVLMNIAMEDTDFSTIVKDSADSGTKLSDILTDRMQSATEISDSYPDTGITLLEGTGESATSPKLTYTTKCGGSAGSWTKPNGPDGKPVTGTCDENGNIDATITMSTTLSDYNKYSFADGTAFWYYKNAETCTDAAAAEKGCYGFIDVNGATGPNTVISCADAAEGTCTSAEITDLYPVIFHGQTVEPATDSARAVLFGK